MGRAVNVEFLLSGVLDASGNPLSSGKVYTYDAGGTTPRTCWTTITKSSTAANPFVLDSKGQGLLYADGLYRMDIKDSNDVLINSRDNLSFFFQDSLTAWGGTSTGSTNVFNVTVSPAPPAYVDGQIFRWKSHQANSSTTPTLNVNSLGAVTIKNPDGTAIASGSIPDGAVCEALYTSAGGGGMLLLSIQNINLAWVGWAPTYSASGAMTVGSDVTSIAKYIKVGKTVQFQLSVTLTTGGVASTAINFSLPVTAATATGNAMLNAHVVDTATPISGLGYLSSTTLGSVTRYDGGNWGLGAGRVIRASGIYEAA